VPIICGISNPHYRLNRVRNCLIESSDTAKKHLEIDPAEAEIARLIYRLALQGDGEGPIGVKSIVSYFNERNLRYRGREFRINEAHRILKSSTYMGLHYYNRKSSKTGKPHDPKVWISMDVPAIASPDEYEAIQKHLKSRRPSITPGRITKGSMLLARIATCPHCGSGMTLRTGKGDPYVAPMSATSQSRSN